MKRDFLQSLDLDKEAIDSIMAEYGKSVQSHQKEVEDLKAAQQDKATDGELQEKYDELSEKYQELEGSHGEAQATLALLKSGAQERYVSLLQREIKAHEDVDLEEAIEKVREQYGDLFESQEKDENPKPEVDLQGFKVKDTKLPQGEPKTWTVEEIMAVEDDKERRNLIAKHPDLFL